MIPYAHQDINEDDIRAVSEVLRSDNLTQGPAIAHFEQTVARYCGAQYAVAVSSATAALHIACLAAGLGKDDLLWTSPITFVASANCALYCAAHPDFVDINSDTYNLDVIELEEKLILARETGQLPKIVIPVHFAGQSCEMEKISELSKQYGFSVIEDASHAIGGRYQGSVVGSCAFSDMTVFSFHPVKIITTGEGGMVLTNRQDYYERLVRLRGHGITRDPAQMEGKPDGPWYYQQIELGFNYRITDIQAALGTSQFKRLSEFVSYRQHLARRYHRLLSGLPLVLPLQHPDTYSAFHLYVVRVDLTKIRKTHRQIFEELRQNGIGVNLHYIPVHLQPHYQRRGFRPGDFPRAEQYYREALSLPLYFGLSESKQDLVVEVLSRILSDPPRGDV
ncbi:Spore coat polysaccharide biosynthesis protein SpsC [Gammaproteobacteria bacterium]